MGNPSPKPGFGTIGPQALQVWAGNAGLDVDNGVILEMLFPDVVERLELKLCEVIVDETEEMALPGDVLVAVPGGVGMATVVVQGALTASTVPGVVGDPMREPAIAPAHVALVRYGEVALSNQQRVFTIQPTAHLELAPHSSMHAARFGTV